MPRFIRTAIPALFALTTATSFAFAQAPAPSAPPAPAAGAQMHHMRPSPETMQRFEDGRFAMIKGALKMTEPQLKLWQPVEDLLRAQQNARIKSFEDRHAAAGGNAAAQPGSLPSLADRLDRESANLTKRAEDVKSLATVVRPFYDQLTPEQKTVAGPLLAHLGGGRGGMHGNRWASREHRGT